MGRVIGELISPEYQAQIRELHGQRQWGDGGHVFVPEIRRLAHKLRTLSVLDYGCGHGTLRPGLPELFVREYDPGIENKDSLPTPADLVVCSDVLEHIEPMHLDAVLNHIYELTEKMCFAVIATRRAHTRLPDGRNAHLIIESGKWWIAKLKQWKWKIEVLYWRERDQIIVCLDKR